MNRRELQGLSRIRLFEAKALLKAGYPDGAYYLAGYSVECGLKACIAKGTKRYDFPDKKTVDASYTHNLNALVTAANLAPAFKERREDRVFLANWELVQEWSERSRYQRHELRSATMLVEAIDNGKHGVMACIRRYW